MLFVCECSLRVMVFVNSLCEILSHCRMFWNSGRLFYYKFCILSNVELDNIICCCEEVKLGKPLRAYLQHFQPS